MSDTQYIEQNLDDAVENVIIGEKLDENDLNVSFNNIDISDQLILPQDEENVTPNPLSPSPLSIQHDDLPQLHSETTPPPPPTPP